MGVLATSAGGIGASAIGATGCAGADIALGSAVDGFGGPTGTRTTGIPIANSIFFSQA